LFQQSTKPGKVVRGTFTRLATALILISLSLPSYAARYDIKVTPDTVALAASQTQQFVANLKGVSGAVVWSLSPAVGTVSSSGLYTAPASVTAAQSVRVIATSAAMTSLTTYATVTLTPATVSVSVSPATADLNSSQSQQFNATVTGSPNTTVSWSLSPAVGMISPGGLYSAPASVPGAQTVTVTATSSADPSKKSSAAVT
jgi:hypothetical protein